jgi:hypothetical protein
MATHFAYFMLFGWPVVVVLLFRKLPRVEALIWSVVAGYLLLPYAVQVKIKMIPAFDKDLIPILAAGLMLLVVPASRGPRRLGAAPPPAATPAATTPVAATARAGANPYARRADPDTHPGPAQGAPDPGEALPRWPGRVMNLLLLVYLVSPFVTVMMNGDPVVVGDNVRVIAGLTLYDGFSTLSGALVAVLPFLIARRHLASSESHVALLRILCAGALLYSLPVLYEWRMSPQLAKEVYGFLAQKFAQAARDGGFRPVVFLQHGLWLALFIATAAIGCFALWRHMGALGRKSRWAAAGVYLAVVLVLCHSAGALAEFLLMLPAVAFLSVRGQLVMAAAVAAVVLLYPALRGSGLIPADEVATFVQHNISAERAQSLAFRLKNEDLLMARADQKPISGWGGWGRAVLHDARGQDITVTDGMWIIVVGTAGWLGYIGNFGLLGMPILLMAAMARRMKASFATAGLAVLLAANLMDMIMNATQTPLTWMVAGALAGRLTLGARPVAARAPAAAGRRGLATGGVPGAARAAAGTLR